MSKTNAPWGYAQRWLTPFLLGCCASACTGVSSLPEGSDGKIPNNPASNGTGGSGTSNGASGMGTTMPTPGGLWSTPPSTSLDAGRAVLARLNNPQYDNTVRDLLGTMSPASATYMIPDDQIDELFDTNGQALVYSDFKFAQMNAAAQGLVAELLGRPATDPVRTRVVTCTPTISTMATCLTSILTPFLAKAYRRPVTADEVTPFVTVGTSIATAHNDPLPGLSGALQAVLLSPNFLFRVERSAVLGSTTPVKINDYELATRLSYFIGSTTPDAPLTAAAAAGQLVSGGATYDAQIDRLLADPVRSAAFVQNFGARWLSLLDTALVAPNEDAFPAGSYDDAIRLGAPQETQLFFANLLADQQPLSALLTANFSFVNDSLAKHYGIPSPGGTGFSKVTFAADAHRQGLLTQETFLTVTSLPARTSPVKRGVWVLENLLCDGTPAPPPGIPNLPAEGSGTVRQVLEQHRAQPFCASCHSVIDPIGLALENYDAIGSYRTLDNNNPVDAKTTTTDGTKLDGAIALSNYLASDPRLTWCLTKQIMTFGVGRSFEQPDGRAYVRGTTTQFSSKPTWTDLIKAVAHSQAFLTTRGEAS
jgi:Protein of unknown function (DUF1588)/Protein of unknown function (DUF1592)/Protein of unknown function (DUF1595)/Protein of unknown function (DUF1587)/Protein of unknown function (DUF1585)